MILRGSAKHQEKASLKALDTEKPKQLGVPFQTESEPQSTKQDSRKRKAAGVFVRGWGVVTLHPHLHTPSLSSGGIKALRQPLNYTAPPRIHC